MKLKNRIIGIFLLSSLFLLGTNSYALSFKKSNFDKELNVLKEEKLLDLESVTPEEIEILSQEYKNVTKELRILLALNAMKESIGNFSRLAIMGDNLSLKPIKVEFKDLSQMGQNYAEFDALGWKKKDRLYIYINQKHNDAPPIALAALLSHEALHQDEFNSINEETYAWTMEAAVWTQLSEEYPNQAQSNHPLVVREDMLKKLFIKGNYSDKYIRKTVISNPGYSNLPSRSPGFEDNL
ncbi:hypothetical protein IJE86_00830 [bacterium]|nr:hypothetical protein [bacterium]